jgi:hypothetical protein
VSCRVLLSYPILYGLLFKISMQYGIVWFSYVVRTLYGARTIVIRMRETKKYKSVVWRRMVAVISHSV